MIHHSIYIYPATGQLLDVGSKWEVVDPISYGRSARFTVKSRAILGGGVYHWRPQNLSPKELHLQAGEQITVEANQHNGTYYITIFALDNDTVSSPNSATSKDTMIGSIYTGVIVKTDKDTAVSRVVHTQAPFVATNAEQARMAVIAGGLTAKVVEADDLQSVEVFVKAQFGADRP